MDTPRTLLAGLAAVDTPDATTQPAEPGTQPQAPPSRAKSAPKARVQRQQATEAETPRTMLAALLPNSSDAQSSFSPFGASTPNSSGFTPNATMSPFGAPAQQIKRVAEPLQPPQEPARPLANEGNQFVTALQGLLDARKEWSRVDIAPPFVVPSNVIGEAVRSVQRVEEEQPSSQNKRSVIGGKRDTNRRGRPAKKQRSDVEPQSEANVDGGQAEAEEEQEQAKVEKIIPKSILRGLAQSHSCKNDIWNDVLAA
jgi:hypothetical protein